MAEVKEMAKPKTNGAHGQQKASADLVPREARRAERLARRASSWALRAGSPFGFMRRFAEEMDRLFDEFGLDTGLPMPRLFGRMGAPPRHEAGLTATEWSPQVEVAEREGKLIVRADLPGMSRDDIKVEVTDDEITIQGERTQEKQEEREGYRYSECSYGSFFRSIPLPDGVDASKASAEFRNGVLEIAVPAPATARSKARRLEIREKT
jgi:HSP20 family protein